MPAGELRRDGMLRPNDIAAETLMAELGILRGSPSWRTRRGSYGTADVRRFNAGADTLIGEAALVVRTRC